MSKHQPHWFVKVRTSKKTEKKGQSFVTITATLKWIDEDGKKTTFHSLTGPTAEKSLADYANKLNANGTLPDFRNVIKCRADGGKID